MRENCCSQCWRILIDKKKRGHRDCVMDWTERMNEEMENDDKAAVRMN